MSSLGAGHQVRLWISLECPCSLCTNEKLLLLVSTFKIAIRPLLYLQDNNNLKFTKTVFNKPFFENDLWLKHLKSYKLSTAWTAVFDRWNQNEKKLEKIWIKNHEVAKLLSMN